MIKDPGTTSEESAAIIKLHNPKKVKLQCIPALNYIPYLHVLSIFPFCLLYFFSQKVMLRLRFNSIQLSYTCIAVFSSRSKFIKNMSRMCNEKRLCTIQKNECKAIVITQLPQRVVYVLACMFTYVVRITIHIMLYAVFVLV